MKMTRLIGAIQGLAICLGSVIGHSSLGQTSSGSGPYATSSIPVVTIKATDPLASWGGNPGVFTVTRSGDPQPSLNVYYQISGTASNGWDYQQIGNLLYIPSQATSGNITIQP